MMLTDLIDRAINHLSTHNRWIGVLGAGLFLTAATYGFLPNAFGSTYVMTAPERSRIVRRTEQSSYNITRSYTIRQGDSYSTVSVRAIRDAIGQVIEETTKAKSRFVPHGRLEGFRATLNGVDITQRGRGRVYRLAKRLPSDPRNAEAQYCLQSSSRNGGCSEYRLRLGKASSPSTVYADLSISFGIARDISERIPAQYTYTTRERPTWYAPATCGGAAASLAATYAIPYAVSYFSSGNRAQRFRGSLNRIDVQAGVARRPERTKEHGRGINQY